MEILGKKLEKLEEKKHWKYLFGMQEAFVCIEQTQSKQQQK